MVIGPETASALWLRMTSFCFDFFLFGQMACIYFMLYGYRVRTWEFPNLPISPVPNLTKLYLINLSVRSYYFTISNKWEEEEEEKKKKEEEKIGKKKIKFHETWIKIQLDLWKSIKYCKIKYWYLGESGLINCWPVAALSLAAFFTATPSANNLPMA